MVKLRVSLLVYRTIRLLAHQSIVVTHAAGNGMFDAMLCNVLARCIRGAVRMAEEPSSESSGSTWCSATAWDSSSQNMEGHPIDLGAAYCCSRRIHTAVYSLVRGVFLFIRRHTIDTRPRDLDEYHFLVPFEPHSNGSKVPRGA